MSLLSDAKATVAKFLVNMGRFDAIMNGDKNTDVHFDTGVVPTIRKLYAQILSGSSTEYSVLKFGAKGDGVTDDSQKIRDAMTAMSANGGGILNFPPTGNFYRMLTGVDVPHGIIIKGAGSRSWYGTDSDPNTWANRGSWIKCEDKSKPAFRLFAPGTGVIGINFLQNQGDPHIDGWAPVQYPECISVEQSWVLIKDVWFAGVWAGIKFNYSGSNGGGTFTYLESIHFCCFKYGVHYLNVNDTMFANNLRYRNIWYPLILRVQAWFLQNCDCELIQYLDNMQATNIEFFQCHIAQRFIDSTVNAGGFNITHAAGYLQYSNVAYNNVRQAISMETGTTDAQLEYHNVLCQWDNTNPSIADVGYMFNLASDKINAIFNGFRVTEVARSLMSIGGGNSGFVKIAGGFSVGSRINGGGYSAATSAADFSGGLSSPCIVINAGATLSMDCGVQDVFGSTNGRSAEFFRGTGLLQGPVFAGNTRFIKNDRSGYVQIEPPILGDTFGGSVTFYGADNVRRGYIGHPGPDKSITFGSDTGAFLQLTGAGKAQFGAVGISTGDVYADGGTLRTQ
jgi:hypothetical protein